MSTVIDIITRAYRNSNLVSFNDNLDSEKTATGLAYINSLVASVLGNEVGNVFDHFNVGKNNVESTSSVETLNANWVVPQNTRLICNLEATRTLNLPIKPSDGARLAVIDSSGNFNTFNLVLNGNGNKIAGASSLTFSTNSANKEYFFRADLGDWKESSLLVTSDDFPFPVEFDFYFITRLSTMLNPSFGQNLDPQTVLNMRDFRNKLRARYSQSNQVGVEEGLLKLTKSGTRYGNDSTGDWRLGIS